MPPRGRKRAASPTDASQQQDPVKKQPKRAAKKAAPITVDDDDDEDVAMATASTPAKTSAKSKRQAAAKVNDGEPERDEAKQKGKGKGKAKVVDDEDNDNSQSKLPSAQYAKAGNLNIPLDEGCFENFPTWSVFIDESDGIIYDASLNQTNAGDNNNKFYKLQIVTDRKNTYKTWSRWGRVGVRGQSKILGNGTFDSALKEFDKKFREKSGLTWADRGSAPNPGKYVFVERSYEPESESEGEEGNADNEAPRARPRSASPVKCTLESPIKSLMELIFNQQHFASTMADMNYDAEKTPLGKLSKTTIRNGYQALKNLSELFDDVSLAQSQHSMTYQQAVESFSNLYYSQIPHSFGFKRPPVIHTHEMLKHEVELLDSLSDLKAADDILKVKSTGDVHPLNAHYNGLRMREMTSVDRKTDEFAFIEEYLVKTRGATHAVNYDLLDVFRIERDGEADRFGASVKADSNRRFLWHGSRSTNYGGILSQGLRIAPPEAPVNGYMFGKGVYLADMSSKSANYCVPYQSDGHALLLLCEAELGNPMQELVNADYNAGENAQANGIFSTWGKGLTGPVAWKDAECINPSLKGVMMPDTTNPPSSTNVTGAYLQYNEYIVYDVAQVRLRYLLRVKM